MVSLERARELLAALNLSDAEIEDARFMAWLLAGIIYDAWKRQESSACDEPPAASSSIDLSPT